MQEITASVIQRSPLLYLLNQLFYRAADTAADIELTSRLVNRMPEVFRPSTSVVSCVLLSLLLLSLRHIIGYDA